MSQSKTHVFFPCVLLALAVLAGGPVLADPPGPADAAGAFASLKRLAGSWQGTNSEGERVQIAYEVVANGSAVVERFVFADRTRPWSRAITWTEGT